MQDKESIKKGYEGFNVPNYEIPSCGIEDVDRAVFNLYDKILAFEVTAKEQTTRVPVVFAAGERFALTRRQRPIRDKNNALILPVIAIKRGAIGYKTETDAGGTPISFRQTTDYVIRKRLAETDRDYQNIINKLSIKNQSNVSSRANFLLNDISPGNSNIPDKFASRRNGTGISFGSGGKLAFPIEDNLNNNIYEIITIPYPIFIQVNYNVVFWCQYMQQMNQMLETMLIKTTGIGREFQMTTDKGYKFTAFLQGSFTSNDNFEEYSGDERIVKCSFDIRVPAYILAPKHPGLGTPFRSFQSAPTINFEINQINQDVNEKPIIPGSEAAIREFILSDVNLINNDGTTNQSRSESSLQTVIETSGKKKYENLVYRDPKAGESIEYGRIVKKIEQQS